jgi:glycosyltransferase involved in cell wall biosynthesis
MFKQQKIIVVLPAYNAAATLALTVKDIPEMVDEIILVDDQSCDETLKVAEELGLFLFRHEKNLGYGANQKTCYRLALDHGADIIIMIHPDYQYDPKLIKFFV